MAQTQHEDMKTPKRARRERKPPQSGDTRKIQPSRQRASKPPADSGEKNTLFSRTVTGAIWAIVIAGCLLASPLSSLFVITVIAVCCSYEFYRMLHADGLLASDVIGMVAVLLYPVAYYVGGTSYLVLLTLLYMLCLLVLFVLYRRVELYDVAVALFGAIYCGLMPTALLVIRLQIPGIQGGLLALGVALSVWANDTFAFFFGSRFGKHKLAPRISPQKSWEGYFAGAAGSIVAWCLVPLFVPQVSWPLAIVAGVICGLVGVLGDFAESRLKRTAGVKDASHVLPGHGGFLDRSDSLIFVSVIALFVIGIGL